MFENCVEQTEFNSTFSFCSKLTSIPAGLFDKNTEVTSFDWMFSYCKSLTRIPAKLFAKNTEVTVFNSTFFGCTALTNIPAGLFDNNTAVTAFHYTFNETSIVAPPYDIFKYNTAVTKMDAFGNIISHMTTLVVNDYAQPSYFTHFGYGSKCCEKLYIWNCMSQERMEAFIEDLPPAEEDLDIVHTLYLAVTPNLENQPITTISEDNLTALTAKGWTFGGLVK